MNIGTLKTKLRIESNEYRLYFAFFGDRIRVSKSCNFDGEMWPADVNWSAIGSVDSETAKEFAEMLKDAASIASTLDFLIEKKEHFKLVKLTAWPPAKKKGHQPMFINIAGFSDEIIVNYPVEWVREEE